MKHTNKIIALMMALAMIFSLCSGAFAAGDTEPNLVVLGDSIAAGAGLRDKSDCFGALIAEANGYGYENFAKNGYTTSDLKVQLQEPEVSEAVSQADIIAISIGGNNFLQNLAVLAVNGLFGNYSKIDEVVAKLKPELEEIALEIRELNPDVTLMVQTLYNPVGNLINNAYAYGTEQLNNAIREVGEKPACTFTVVEVAETFEGHSNYIQNDFTHPNEMGHYVIACEYLEVLAEMGLGTALTPESDPADLIDSNFWYKVVMMMNKALEIFRNLVH
ncbi:MAG: GDSL-type esterase/lipase family protein [Oscillospiraceae bacterium]|nr:GDSL-type esterase/lipase family protein [Oscillospiraceae bacterium]